MQTEIYSVNRRTFRIDNGLTTYFAYNPRNEVMLANLDGETDSYHFDDIGNLCSNTVANTSSVFSANSINQYSSINDLVLSYDLDGNLLTNGVWSYTWDSANRLTTVSSNGVLLVTNEYDTQSRRVQKLTPNTIHTFFYDDWNLVLEYVDYPDGSRDTISYIWGPDLSGTLQGAGGIGGLYWLEYNDVVYVPSYDNNANITQYYHGITGETVASYTYDAFGRTIGQSGFMASFFRHRFSTKYYDEETGLYYYGYRFYAPEMGRWINRDPIEENDGVNIYVFCENNGNNRYDVLGMASVKVLAYKPTTFWEYIASSNKNKIVEIHSAEEVPVERIPIDGALGLFDDKHAVIRAYNCADFIEIFPKISIQPGLASHGVKGRRYRFSKHRIGNGVLVGGGGNVLPCGIQLEGPVLEHEWGHAQAFFELVLPRFRSSIEARFPQKLRDEDTDEVRHLFLHAIRASLSEEIEMVFMREYEWYKKNGYTITSPSSFGVYYEASF